MKKWSFWVTLLVIVAVFVLVFFWIRPKTGALEEICSKHYGNFVFIKTQITSVNCNQPGSPSANYTICQLTLQGTKGNSVSAYYRFPKSSYEKGIEADLCRDDSKCLANRQATWFRVRAFCLEPKELPVASSGNAGVDALNKAFWNYYYPEMSILEGNIRPIK